MAQKSNTLLSYQGGSLTFYSRMMMSVEPLPSPPPVRAERSEQSLKPQLVTLVIHKEGNKMSYEIDSDGRTVWVNGFDGCCWGRFSRYGIDVHHKGAAQVTLGTQCLECVGGPMEPHHWEQFKDAMMRHHAVVVDDRHMPGWLMRKNVDIGSEFL
jgi:hypothetical protein